MKRYTLERAGSAQMRESRDGEWVRLKDVHAASRPLVAAAVSSSITGHNVIWKPAFLGVPYGLRYLYMSPPVAAVPLSDDQIREEYRMQADENLTWADGMNYGVRWAEKMHGVAP